MIHFDTEEGILRVKGTTNEIAKETASMVLDINDHMNEKIPKDTFLKEVLGCLMISKGIKI